ncbi:MAG: hypothetical protein ACYDDS_00745 [Candidatus Sulfotelmatobacter sp.]|jgi:hypothetical protein
MSKTGILFYFYCVGLFLITLFSLACGGSSTRQLQSLSISPAAGSTQVQFTAIGTFVGSSQTAAVNAMWWTNQPWTYPPTPLLITVSSNGLAQCETLAAAGTYTIWAVAPVDPSVPLAQMTMTTKQVSATAQLTCP